MSVSQTAPGPPPPPAPPAPELVPIAARTVEAVKVYGRGETAVRALDGISADFVSRQFTAIMGASGSGKSTLLHCLAGLDRLTSGQTFIAGYELGRLTDRQLTLLRREKVGFIFQSLNLVPTLNALDNIVLPLTIAGRKPEPGVVEGVVQMTGLADRLKHRPGELSGGQQQRVALARALAVRPRIVLLDEPFASLDAGLRASVRADVRAAVQRSGATAVLVTHDQEEALSLADVVAVIRDGAIAQVASPRDLYESPVDPDLARFVGEANLVEGTSYGSTAETPLGWLELRDGHRPARQQVVVLVRPEQLRVTPSEGGGPGVAARVVETGFHGHDSLVSLVTEDAAASPMVARVVGGMRLEAGAQVTIKVAGKVHCWPRPPAGEAAPGAPAAEPEGEPG